MHFLTEDDLRTRCTEPGCTLRLAATERLTPSAAEFANQMRVQIVRGTVAACATGEQGNASAPCPSCDPAGSGNPGDYDRTDQGMTHLDAAAMVIKSHPRIVLRGKLDTLMAKTVLVQTQFDPKNRLSGFLKECLADLKNWIVQVLTAEVTGSILTVSGMGGMDVQTLHTLSRDPGHLGLNHVLPDASLGGNLALLNWLRAEAREAEVAAVQSELSRADIAGALNRLSSAVYVLMLLTLAAEQGLDVTKLRKN